MSLFKSALLSLALVSEAEVYSGAVTAPNAVTTAAEVQDLNSVIRFKIKSALSASTGESKSGRSIPETIKRIPENKIFPSRDKVDQILMKDFLALTKDSVAGSYSLLMALQNSLAIDQQQKMVNTILNQKNYNSGDDDMGFYLTNLLNACRKGELKLTKSTEEQMIRILIEKGNDTDAVFLLQHYRQWLEPTDIQKLKRKIDSEGFISLIGKDHYIGNDLESLKKANTIRIIVHPFYRDFIDNEFYSGLGNIIIKDPKSYQTAISESNKIRKENGDPLLSMELLLQFQKEANALKSSLDENPNAVILFALPRANKSLVPKKTTINNCWELEESSRKQDACFEKVDVFAEAQRLREYAEVMKFIIGKRKNVFFFETANKGSGFIPNETIQLLKQNPNALIAVEGGYLPGCVNNALTGLYPLKNPIRVVRERIVFDADESEAKKSLEDIQKLRKIEY